MHYASHPSEITDSRIKQSFTAYLSFLQSQESYYSTPIRHIGICGNMSAGKSTFINALLGQDCLPARNEATTACVTSLYDNDSSTQVYGIANKNGQTYAIDDNADNATLNAWNESAEHIVLQADIKNISNEHIVVAFHDTPGVNNSVDESHYQITMDFLQKEHNDLIIYVANASQLGINDEYSLLVSLVKLLQEKPAKILFILNKCDCLDTEKDGSIENALEKCKKFLENTGFENPNIYPLSSIAARLFKMVLNDHSECLNKREKRDFLSFLDAFCEDLNLDSSPLESYISSEATNGTIEFESQQIEKEKLYLALKNTGFLKLERDIENLLKHQS